jgi:hypothetical protein
MKFEAGGELKREVAETVGNRVDGGEGTAERGDGNGWIGRHGSTNRALN